MGQIIGYFIGSFILFPALVLGIVWGVQYLRTRDGQRARRAALSWWSIGLAVVLTLMGIVGQAANTFA